MGVFSRSWEVTKLSFGIIKKDKEMLIFPILSSIFSLIFMAALLVPTVIMELINDMGPEAANNPSLGGTDYLFLFLTYFGLALIATFFNVCVVYTTKVRLEGGNATFWESIKFGFSKFGKIIQWAFISAIFGVILAILQSLAEKLGTVGRILVGFLRGLLSFAWGIATIFLSQGIVYYNLSPGNAIKHSVEVLKRTWGESIVRHFGLGLIEGIMVFLGIIATAVLAVVFASISPTAMIIVIIIGVIYFAMVILVFNVANSVFNTVLFVYADKGTIPELASPDVVQNAFKVKKIRARN